MFCYEQHLVTIVFIWAIPLLWIISPIDVFSFFDDLGIFDCISRACWGNSMYCHCTVNVIVFTASMNYWPDNEHRDHKQAKKRNRTYTNRYLFKDKHVEIACEWGSLSRHVKTRRIEAKIFLADCLAIGRQVNRYRRPKHSLWLNKRCIWNGKAKIVKISTHQRY